MTAKLASFAIPLSEFLEANTAAVNLLFDFLGFPRVSLAQFDKLAQLKEFLLVVDVQVGALRIVLLEGSLDPRLVVRLHELLDGFDEGIYPLVERLALFHGVGLDVLKAPLVAVYLT